MLELNELEYSLVMKSLLHISDYLKPEFRKQTGVTEAIQILKSTTKGKTNTNTAVPSGGSYCSCFSCKGTKIKSLMHMFGL